MAADLIKRPESYTVEDLHKPLMRENFLRAVITISRQRLTAGDIAGALKALEYAVRRLKEAERG